MIRGFRQSLCRILCLSNSFYCNEWLLNFSGGWILTVRTIDKSWQHQSLLKREEGNISFANASEETAKGKEVF